MSNAQHTPGPWAIKENGDANSYAIFGADNNWLLSFLHNGEALTEKQRANACLIAAAPDLLEALEALAGLEVRGHALHARLQFSDAGRALSERVTAAINKAKGLAA